MAVATPCAHIEVVGLNPYELIRKYRCLTCDGVMMCDCDEAFGRRFLAHQLSQATVLETQERVAVTHGFQWRACRTCRGLEAEPAPKAPSMGATSKIKRYYWRELWFEETRRLDDWRQVHPDADQEAEALAKQEIDAAVLSEIKAQHALSPKYVYREVSDHDVLTLHKVVIENLTADYVPNGRKGAIIKDGDQAISPEAFAIKHFHGQGKEAFLLESAPFIALFAVMMALVIVDPSDPEARYVGFGDRDDFEAGRPSRQIWTSLPTDFGTTAYPFRRDRKLTRFFAELPRDREQLLWTYDYFKGVSGPLRQYLWVHREADFVRGRHLIERLPPEAVIAILEYLVGGYWARHLGWPDLLVLDRARDDFFLAEVKSSKDSLSEEQKRWIADNDGQLRLPFRLVKVHRGNPSPKTRVKP